MNNKTYLQKQGINPSTLGLLVMIKNGCFNELAQNTLIHYLYEYTLKDGKKVYEELLKADLIKLIKTGKKKKTDHDILNVRLSVKGQEVLDRMFEKPQNPLSEYFLKTLQANYERIGASKTLIKTQNKTLGFISELLNYKEDKYTELMIDAICYTYTTEFEYDKKYLPKIDNLFYKADNVFSHRWTPDNCPMLRWIDLNTDKLKYYIKRIKDINEKKS